jgi:tripartite-type tricarboxylate transporter receptor subunit TctC
LPRNWRGGGTLKTDIKGDPMKLMRRQLLQVAASASFLSALSRSANAQAYPTRPITLIVPFPAGGSGDVVGRVLIDEMTKSLGQPIIIENVAGADGSIGVGRVARARPDGYTIELGFLSTHVLNGAFYSLPYHVLNDFAPISLLFASPFVIFARRSMPAKNLQELIAWLKMNPDKASMGLGTLSVRALAAFFQKETGTHFTVVPYRSFSLAIQDVVAAQIDFAFATLDQLRLMQAGSIKALAVTSDARVPLAPEVPTFAEMGLPALSYSSWVGLFAPRGTSSDAIRKLNAAVVEALANSAVRRRYAELGFEVFPREQQTAEALGAMVKADADKWWPIIKELGIKAHQ